MNRRITAMLLGLTLAAPAAGASDLREQTAHDWDGRGVRRIEVDNPRGLTVVRPSRDGRVHLVALKVVHHAERDGARELSRQTHMEAESDAGTLRLTVRYPQRREIRVGILDLVKGIEIPEVEMRLAIEAPPALEFALRSLSGDLETTALAGRQELRTSSGDIDVADASGPLTIDTRSGDATLGDVGSASIGTASGNIVIGSARGAVAASSRSGDVRVDSANDTVAVETSSGGVRVGFARGGLEVSSGSGDVVARGAGRVRVRTASGEAKVALAAPLAGASIASSSGDVTVRVAPGIDCRLDADAGSGDVAVELPLEVRTSHDNHVTGRLGRGTTPIVIRSSSGSINVAR